MSDFAHLKSFCGPKELQELYKTFADECETLLTDLAAAINDKNMDGGKKLAHQLKGLAATLAATDMQTISANLEAKIKEANWEQAAPLYDQLAQTVVVVRNDLKKAAFPDTL